MRQVLALLVLCVALAGCGLGAGDSPSGGAGTELTVSRNFGAEEVGHDTRKAVPGGETVMRQLQRQFEVQTRYGGGFVQEIDGVSGGRRSGRPVDWFYYVNGIEAESGAAARRLEPGDRVWWDHHDWGAAMRIPAVVGSFPEPFVNGAQGKKLPIRIDCANDSVRDCREVRKRLEAAGAKVGGSGTLGTRAGPGVLRLLVGTWSEVRVDPTARRLEKGPKVSGVFARPNAGGHPVRSARRARRRRALARPGLGAGRRDALPRPAADVGGHRHRPGRRGVGRRGARGEAVDGPLRGRARARARGAAAAAGDGRRGHRERDGPVTYRRRDSPLHAARAGVGSLFCVVLAGVALSFEHPLLLGAVLLAVLAAAVGAQVGHVVARSLLWGLPFALLIAAINALVVRDGLTVIARFGKLPPLGEIDVTLEATVYGAILGLRALIVIACFALHSAAVDPDELLRAFRRLSFRSALTAALATRMVPVLARDARRFRDAQRCRPGQPASRLALARAVTSGALDRAVDVAATLEVRGYGGARAPGAAPAAVVAARRRVRGVDAPARRAGDRGGGGWVGEVRGVPAAGGAGRRGRAGARGGPVGSSPGCPSPTARGSGDERRCPTTGGHSADEHPRPTTAGPGRMSELVLDRVTYTYPGAARPALADVSLRVEPGEFVVLAGGSGSGKSTLLRAAAGLVPHFHGGEFAGRLVAGGLDSREHGPAELSAVAGSLFQDPETQVVMGTVRAELAFPLENRGWGAAAVARGVEEAALALGVAGLLDRSTHELSGGELQRVALGAALAGRPRLLLLDEPTSQLDPVAGDELLGVLRRVNEEWGTAVVLAEHRLERCLAAADRVIALEDGAVTIDADPRGFLEQAPPALQTPGARLFAAAGLTRRRSR